MVTCSSRRFCESCFPNADTSLFTWKLILATNSNPERRGKSSGFQWFWSSSLRITVRVRASGALGLVLEGYGELGYC